MHAETIEAHATRLYDELGPRAIATAAQRAVEAEKSGRAEDAHSWRRIEERLKEHRGARQS